MTRRFRYNPSNLLDDGTDVTLSGFTEDPLMPVANLWGGRSSRRCGLAGSKSGAITLDFGEAVSLDHLALVNHNLTSLAVVRLQADASGAFADPTPVDLSHDVFAPESVIELEAAATFRYWRIGLDDPSRAEMDLKIGQLVLGTWTEFAHNPDWSFTEGVEHETIQHESDGGAVWGYEKFTRRTLQFRFSNLPENAAQDVREFWTRVGGGRTPFLMVLDDLPYWVRTRGGFSLTRPFPVQGFEWQGSSFSYRPDFTTSELVMVEESRGLRVST